MAIYGISFYGDDPYGPETYVDFSVGTFVAEPVGFDGVDLSWTSPKGTWDRLRVLKNMYGFSVDEQDGVLLADTSGALSSLVDHNTQPGAWHYYSIWILYSGTWYRAGIATTLMLQDHGYGDRMFESLPLYHQYLQGITDDLPPVENETLRTFLSVLGSGLDYVKTYYNTLRLLNDPMQNHVGQLEKLAAQLGIEHEPVTPPHLFRSRVLNAGTLARSKGTLEQIASVVGMTVGWNIETSVGANLMLSEDSASFVHPVYPIWDTTMNYSKGERVTYNGYIYQASGPGTGGAYGDAQQPSGTATTNTYWSIISALTDTTLVDADGAVAGWESVSYTNGVSPGPASTSVGIGMQSATDATVSSANTLVLSNKSAQTADLGVHSTAGSKSDPLKAITRGVPVPMVGQPWDTTVTYEPGALVTYNLLNYRALLGSTSVPPTGTTTDSTVWQCLGLDDRLDIMGSLYVKGATGYQTLLAYPVMEFFDDRGRLITTLDTSVDQSTNIFDGFSTRAGDLSLRTTDVGGATWTVRSGGWKVINGYTVPISTASSATITGAANGCVAATFHMDSVGPSKVQAVTFRGTTSTTYLKATRTALYSTNAGVDTLIATYTTAFKDKDRITITFNGTAITVARNGATVLSATSSFNQTGTWHGILVA